MMMKRGWLGASLVFAGCGLGYLVHDAWKVQPLHAQQTVGSAPKIATHTAQPTAAARDALSRCGAGSPQPQADSPSTSNRRGFRRQRVRCRVAVLCLGQTAPNQTGLNQAGPNQTMAGQPLGNRATANQPLAATGAGSAVVPASGTVVDGSQSGLSFDDGLLRKSERISLCTSVAIAV